jgi:hypothetical protein
MKESALERVKKLAQKLSPEDRAKLFAALAELPDSLIKPLPPPQLVERPRLPPDQEKALKDIQIHYEVRRENDEIIYSFEGKEVFRLSFNAENYADVFFEKLKHAEPFLRIASEEQRQRIYQGVRDVLKEENLSVTDEQIKRLESQAIHELELRILKDSILDTAKRMDDSLPQVAAMIFPKVSQAVILSSAKEFHKKLHVPQRKFTEAETRAIVQGQEWEHLRRIMGITAPSRGGAHNIKHPWTNRDRECLAAKYAELEPIWQDAKVIAREAQNSQIKNRKAQWREEVLRQYPHLPSDLLEGFATPRGGSRPSENAIIHASRECGITPGISARRLKDVVKEWSIKRHNRTSSKAKKSGTSKK